MAHLREERRKIKVIRMVINCHREKIIGHHFSRKITFKLALFKYIESWYNREQIHRFIYFMRPHTFKRSLVD